MNGNPGKFERALDLDQTFAQYCERYKDLGLPPQQLRRLYDKQRRDAMYLSDQYQVAIDKQPAHGFAGMTVWHLSIKRLDKEPIMDWRDLQAIKTQLCGAECEALQLFPAESRVVDTSNQYHLFAFMKGSTGKFPRLPIGWATGMTTDDPGVGARQRSTVTGETP